MNIYGKWGINQRGQCDAVKTDIVGRRKRERGGWKDDWRKQYLVICTLPTSVWICCSRAAPFFSPPALAFFLFLGALHALLRHRQEVKLLCLYGSHIHVKKPPC